MNAGGTIISKMYPTSWESQHTVLVIYCWEGNHPQTWWLKTKRNTYYFLRSCGFCEWVLPGLGALRWHHSHVRGLCWGFSTRSLILQEASGDFLRLWIKGSQPQERASPMQKQFLSLCSSHLWYFPTGKSKLYGQI